MAEDNKNITPNQTPNTGPVRNATSGDAQSAASANTGEGMSGKSSSVSSGESPSASPRKKTGAAAGASAAAKSNPRPVARRRKTTGSSSGITKKPAGKVPINIQKLTEQRLLDSKLVRPEPDRMSRVVMVSLLIGILAGGVVLGILFFSQSDLIGGSDETENIPNIDLGDLELLPAPGSEDGSDGENSGETPEPPTPVVQQAEILNTPTGYLNVRTGPGTNFEQIDRVNPGEVYELVSTDEQAGWYEIRLDETRTGWVIDDYAAIK